MPQPVPAPETATAPFFNGYYPEYSVYCRIKIEQLSIRAFNMHPMAHLYGLLMAEIAAWRSEAEKAEKVYEENARIVL